MVLVRRHGGASSLVVTVEALSDASFIYPLEVAASIPSPSGGSAARVTVRADGAREQRVSLRIPNDIETGAVIDLFLVADRVTAGNKALAPRSLRVVGISQE
jgi:hypothetical protein